MERREGLAILILTLRRSATATDTVLDRYESGEREATFPHSLARAFRAVEHDARTLSLPRLAEFAEAAKEAAARPIEAWSSQSDFGVLRRAAEELRQVAAHLDSSKRHKLDQRLLVELRERAKPSRSARPSAPSTSRRKRRSR